MEDETEKVLSKVLDPAELEQIPPETRKKLEDFYEQRLNEFYSAKAIQLNIENVRQELETKNAELSAKLLDGEAKLQSYDELIRELRQQLDTSRGEVVKLQDTVARYGTEVYESKMERNAAVDERDSLLSMVERRNGEVERQRADIVALESQLQSAIAAKCEVLAKIDDIESKETSLNFKEKRLEQEKEMMTNQIATLREDLHRNIAEMQTIRRDNTVNNIKLETKLTEKTEELKITQNTIGHLEEANASLVAKLEEMNNKLRQNHEESDKVIMTFQKELSSKTKLVEMLKESARENQEQIKEFSDCVTELKKLLTEATDKTGELETRQKGVDLKHAEELEEKDATIQQLRQEIEHANELLKEVQEQNLENAIHNLAPTAAASSRMIKSGMTLTEIFTLYVKATEELQVTKKENNKLNLQIRTILQEIEEKAPLIRKQSLEYQKIEEANAELSQQLDNLMKQRVESAEEFNGTVAKLGYLERENKKLKQSNGDLGRQVCFLVREIEQMRGGFSSEPDQSITSDMLANEVITRKLVTFSDVQELQENNQKLLNVVRDLSTKLEEMEEAENGMDKATYEAKIANYTKRVNELQASQEYQTQMMSVCMQQRDRFKKLYHETLKSGGKAFNLDGSLSGQEQMEGLEEETPLASNSSVTSNENSVVKDKKIGELEGKLKDSAEQLKSLKEDYENYRKDRAANEKMLNEQFDTMRSEILSLTSSNCKLMSTVEFNSEQIKLQQKNVATYKKQIETLEERNKNYETSIVKHEQTIMILKDEVMSAQKKLTEAEVMVENLKQQLSILRDSEARLKLDKEMLHRERHTNNLLMNNIEMLKVSFERSETGGKLLLETRLDETVRECSALRRRLQEEQDRFRELSQDLERRTETAKKRMQEEVAQVDKIREELRESREDVMAKTRQIEELSHKLQDSLTPNRSDNPIVQAQKRAKELEFKNEEYRLSIESLQKELMTTKENVQQYCKLSESSEKELRDMAAEYEKFKLATSAELTKVRESEASLKARVEELETEISLQITGAQLIADEDDTTQLRKTQTELRDVLQKLSDVNRELRYARDELSSLRSNLQSVEAKYAHEMSLHSADLQVLSNLKEELNKVKETVGEFKMQRDRAVEELECSKRGWQETEKHLKADRVSVDERLADLVAQNAALHDQFQELSTKLIFGGDGDKDDSSVAADSSLVNRSLVEGETSPSAGQLLQIIKYLRKEKDIAYTEVDVLKAENARLTSESRIVQKRLEDTSAALMSERTKSDVGIASATKHEDILRKVETLNAITDSNRSLREERDLLQNKIRDLTAHIGKVELELFPLQEQNREMQTRIDEREAAYQALKVEMTRWKQRANQLIERNNKTNPDIFKNMQNERESLAQMLTSEREILKKTNAELSSLKSDKAKVDSEVANLTKQVATMAEENKKHTGALANMQATNAKLMRELMEVKNSILAKEDEMKKLTDDVKVRDDELTKEKSKVIQLRKFARQYKDRCERLEKNRQGGKEGETEQENNQQNVSSEPGTSKQEAENPLQEKVTELNMQLEEMENLRKENETLKQFRENDERNVQLLKDAKTRIIALQDSKNTMSRELVTAKNQLQSIEQSQDMVMTELKSQYEGRLTKLEKELSDAKENQETILRLQRDNESLVLRVNQLHRQLQMPQGAKPTTSSSTTEKGVSESPRTANVKPMAGPSHQSATVTPWRGGETPLASIRPMSVQNRTAAVLPTNVAAVQGSSSSVTALVPPQQQVHTTGNNSGEAMSSSPTSSHTDYMPATSSAAIVVAAVPPMGTASTQAESSQEAESAPTGNNGESSSFSSTVVVSGQQQAVALVSPRVEGGTSQSIIAPQINEQSQTPSTSGTSSNQAVIISSHHQASSSSTVTTTQAGSHKRPRDVEGDSSTGNAEEPGEKSQPQIKRTRLQAGETFQGVSESGLDVEYQVPTSSQRDQEDDIIVVDSEEEEEDDGMADEGTPDDGPFDDEVDNSEIYEMEGYEQEQEMGNYDEGDGPDVDEDNVPSDNNEVEVDDSNEIPNQSGSSSSNGQIAPDAGSSTSQVGQSSLPPEVLPEQQPIEGSSTSGQNVTEVQQIQAISSGSEAGSSTPSTWRQITPHSRQQQSATHLVLIQQSSGYEPETGDERIVPSTPTLFAPRRADGFSEVISSPHPQVPHAARFTFTEATRQSALVPGGNLEGMDDTQIDLSQLDEANASTTGRSVPNTPKLISPHDVDSAAGEGSSSGQPVVEDQQEQQHEEEQQEAVDLRQESEAGTSQSQPVITIQEHVDDDDDGSDDGSEDASDEGNDNDDADNLDHTASTSERTKSDKEDSNLPSGDEPEGTDGVSSEGEKAPGAEGIEIEEGREAEASTTPSINTRSRSAGLQPSVSMARRATGRVSRARTPIVWNQGSGRGREPIGARAQPMMQEPNSMGRNSFPPAPRGQRGRRMRRPSGSFMRY
ncbi:nucleoprotein TPR isoform X2 [Phlebotomus argentipes]|uniref:nucleoprotein TPR isoform X2 n=1 Tax=Phlebotomus argentipes TaxID=94469 RepID=UPI00289351F5|nr:nucleoprotein TPR isoform X2 [Phlebotomus argentipes]